jgi:hypothetical protein
LDVGNLTVGRTFVIERAASLPNWDLEITQQATAPAQSVVLTTPSGVRTSFYRVRAL